MQCPHVHLRSCTQLRSDPTIQSFQCAAVLPENTLPGHLPLWILQFWRETYKVREGCTRWKVCKDWVVSKPHINASLRDRLEKTLINVRWWGSLDGRRCDRTVKDIFDLLSNNELNSGQIDDLLELVERDLSAWLDGTTPPLIASTDLAQILLFAYRESDNPNFQKTHLQATVEGSLVENRASSVASVAWISLSGIGHWVSYTVNPASSLVSYDNSLGGPIPVLLSVALQ